MSDDLGLRVGHRAFGYEKSGRGSANSMGCACFQGPGRRGEGCVRLGTGVALLDRLKRAMRFSQFSDFMGRLGVLQCLRSGVVS